MVEGEEDDPEYSPQDDEYKPPPPRRVTPPRRSTRGENKSPEPELVMPSLDLDSIDGSWADTTSRSAKTRANQSAERVLEARRRNTRLSNASPVKPTRIKDPSNGAPIYPSDSNNFRDMVDVAVEHLTAIMSWFLDVLTGALKVLKKPLSYFLAVWLLFGIAVIVRNLVTNSIYASMSPLCRIPGASLLSLPFCPVHRVDTSHGSPPPVEFNDLMAVQSKFEEVLEESAGGVSLPLDMKRGEASIRDLRQLVRYSQLHSK